MMRVKGDDLGELTEYIVNSANAWTLPTETDSPSENGMLEQWDQRVASLDTAILSMIGDEEDFLQGEVASMLDAVLQSSLWQRSLRRHDESLQRAMKAVIRKRCEFIWASSTSKQRRGYFLAGVGLKAGRALDEMASEVNQLIRDANESLLAEDAERTIAAITSFAEKIFRIHPFKPRHLPEDWQRLIRCWLSGEPVARFHQGSESETLRFIETALVYQLSWAMEAVRVRAEANDEMVADDSSKNGETERGLAVIAVETGTMNRSASILIRVGFSSRRAAIKVAEESQATFTTVQGIRSWLNSNAVVALSEQPDWPNAEINALWSKLEEDSSQRRSLSWIARTYESDVIWDTDHFLSENTPVHVFQRNGRARVLAPDGHPLGFLQATLNPNRRGLIRARIAAHQDRIQMDYLGPDDLFSEPAL